MHQIVVSDIVANRGLVTRCVSRSAVETHLLFQSHDCVHSEVSALTGVGDAHRAGQKETGSQHLQAASSKTQTKESNTKFRDRVRPAEICDGWKPRRHQPVGHVQGEGLPGRVVHHRRVTLEQNEECVMYRHTTQSGEGLGDLWSYQQVQDPGSERFKAREAQPQVLQQADQHFDPEDDRHETI